MVVLILEPITQAVNAVIAGNSAAARLLLASNQLNECILRNDPRAPGNSWLPGMISQQNQWGPDPCAKEREAVESLQQQAAGNQAAALQNLGAAPAPQLAHPQDPVPSTDPAIPVSEYVAPDPGMNSPWDTPNQEEIVNMIVEEFLQQRAAELTDEDLMEIESIFNVTRKLILWCPWGLPGVRNLKWKYSPKNIDWLRKWVP